jgi:hypothetical protein
MEQRAKNTFRFKFKKRVTKRIKLLKFLYGITLPLLWKSLSPFKTFKQEQEDLEESHRKAELSAAQTAETVTKILEMFTGERRSTLKLMKDMHIPTGRQVARFFIMIRKLGTSERKFFHILTKDRKDEIFIRCEDFIQNYQNNPHFYNRIFTGDGSWVFRHDPEINFQSVDWRTESSTRPKIFRFQNYRSQRSLITIFFFCITDCDWQNFHLKKKQWTVSSTCKCLKADRNCCRGRGRNLERKAFDFFCTSTRYPFWHDGECLPSEKRLGENQPSTSLA